MKNLILSGLALVLISSGLQATTIINMTAKPLKIAVTDKMGKVAYQTEGLASNAEFPIPLKISEISSIKVNDTELKMCKIPGSEKSDVFVNQLNFDTIEVLEDKGKLILECKLGQIDLFVG